MFLCLQYEDSSQVKQVYFAFTFYVVFQVDFKCDVVLDPELVIPKVVSLL